MTLQAPMRCSALAEQLDEPMAGTVDQRRRWLLVEDRSAWGSDAVRDLFGTDAALAKQLGMRLLLVRRREGPPEADAVRRVMLVDTVAAEMSVRVIGDLGDLSVEAAATVPLVEFGDPVPGPLFLVCTNGKRDACCALRGRALVGALAATHGDRVWECTHLGGHRFAGNLVCLPDGLVYGRMTAENGPRVAGAYLGGRVEPELLRGRSAWPAPAQVAEIALRQRLGLVGTTDVHLAEAAVDGTSAAVTLAVPDGTAHRFELVAERLSPRPISCRADELEEPLHWRVAGD
ncbi:MAG: sucrase ferredoxin [Chloroflexota bacterium]|nr:sucrase ferredoxin [Chloroflexota bacterium]